MIFAIIDRLTVGEYGLQSDDRSDAPEWRGLVPKILHYTSIITKR